MGAHEDGRASITRNSTIRDRSKDSASTRSADTPIHFHHYFGPKQTPAGGYQFTLIGNAIDGAPKWGVTVHNSHYGLVQDNVVYNTHGAGIVTEDGTESYNVFDHKLRHCVPRAQATSRLAVDTVEPAPIPGGEGGGFWFRGPNNYIRNNVRCQCGCIRVSSLRRDCSRPYAFLPSKAPIWDPIVRRRRSTQQMPRYWSSSTNEAYGAIQTGVAFGWKRRDQELQGVESFTPWSHRNAYR